MNKSLMLLGAFFLFGTHLLFAQGKITGKVTDAKTAIALPNISVKIKGSDIGTITNADGSFSIDVPAGNVIVEFSGAGYITQTIKAKPDDVIDISFEPSVQTLSDVVVTGVGTATSKRRLAIDVGTLSTKDAAKSSLGSVEQALVGQIAGAQVQFISGTPGSSPIIILRTLNSLQYAPPLIMLDGVEIASLDGIDLASIDRVEVVKGAAGGMLYGAQGANGVIQIFSKKGVRNGKLRISFLSQASIGQVILDHNIIAKYHSFQTDADGYITKGGVRIEPDATGLWPDPDFLDPNNPADGGAFVVNNKPYKEKTYNHLKQAYRDAATFNNSVSLRGGGDKTDYAVTISHYDEQNVLSNTYSKTNISTNLGYQLTKGLTFRNILQTVFTNEDLESGDADASIGQTSSNRFGIFDAWPFINYKAKDSTGHIVVDPRNSPGSLNPLSESQWRQRGSNTTRIIENGNLNYKFPRFLELDYKYGIDESTTDDNNYYLNQTTSLQAGIAHWGSVIDGSITNTYTKNVSQNSLVTAILKTDFQKDFHLRIPITTTTQFAYDYRKYQERQYAVAGYSLPTYPPYDVNAAADITGFDNYYTFVTFGTLFTQSIDYKELVGISGGYRSDYSSNYGEGHTPFVFPRGSIYFRPTELFKMGPVTEWKLRATYAEAGIQPPTYSSIATLQPQSLGGAPILSYTNSITNPDLQVEVSKELEIGTDVVFRTHLKNWLQRISVSFNYWQRKGLNVIQDEDLAASSGFTQKLDNLATLDSKGFDLSLDAAVVSTKNVDWEFGYRIGAGKTIATKIANGADIVNGLFTVQQGQALGGLSFQAPLSNVNQIRPDGTRYIDASQVGNYQIVNGMVVDTASKKVLMTDPTDKKYAGSTLPKFVSSFINTFQIKKNLIFSFQWDWTYGNKIYNTTRQWLYRDRLSADYDKAVTINGNTGAYVNYYNSLYNSLAPNNYFVENGSYLRLRDVSLTYNFSDALHINWIKQLALTLSARNLVTITKYSGLDPEATTTADEDGTEARGGFASAAYGTDYFAVPNLRSYQISLRVGF